MADLYPATAAGHSPSSFSGHWSEILHGLAESFFAPGSGRKNLAWTQRLSVLFRENYLSLEPLSDPHPMSAATLRSLQRWFARYGRKLRSGHAVQNTNKISSDGYIPGVKTECLTEFRKRLLILAKRPVDIAQVLPRHPVSWICLGPKFIGLASFL